MKMKAVLASILCLTLFAGCGYKMALPGLKPAFTLYVNKVDNKTDEIDGYRIFSNEIYAYLATVDGRAPESTADYNADFVLNKVSLSPAVKLKSGQTATVDLSIIMTATIKDKSGNVVFEKQFSATSSYSQAYSLSLSMSNRDGAIKEAVRIAMDNFRNDFENR